MTSEHTHMVALCPGQGAQVVGMGKSWSGASNAAREIIRNADSVLSGTLPSSLSEICFEGPPDLLNRTDVSQPAIFTCSVASYQGMRERGEATMPLAAAAGLSLGEYTALHLAGVFDFETGLRLVARRGALMQEAAEASAGDMVALIGAEEAEAEQLCHDAAQGGVLVCANFNAPGQIVLSGDRDACQRAAELANHRGFRATPLTVAGAFHSPHMQPAADGLAEVLAQVDFHPPEVETWSNVTAEPHDPVNMELLKQRLVEQLIQPVRWSALCQGLTLLEKVGFEGTEQGSLAYDELAPGNVLRGLMRRINRDTKVSSHDEPS